VQEMTVKSWINGPGTDGAPLKAGDTQIHGVAFGGMNAVAKVEVSLDGGKTWQLARMVGPDLGRFAWRQFVFAARLPAGQFTLASRATDTAGNVQPEQRMENAGGYNNTSWADHAADDAAQLQQGKVLFGQGAVPACALCHALKDAGAEGAVGPSLDELKPDAKRVATALRNGIGQMPSYNGKLSDAQIAALAAYVAKASGGSK
jgi:mono/diheme cytochrome c family protein